MAAVRLMVNVELTDKYAALSMSTVLTADDEPSLNTAEPLVGTYTSPLTAYNTVNCLALYYVQMTPLTLAIWCTGGWLGGVVVRVSDL